MKKEKGIALVALIIIIIAIGIIVFTALQQAKNYLNNQKNEDKKAEMLAIQTIITNIENKHIVNEDNPLLGTKLEIENNTTGYNITDDLKHSLETEENSNLYILSNEDLKNNGITNVEVNENDFYIVDYNSGEIFYSLGVNGKYKLSEM